jgi:hypothetical protein
MFHGLMHRLHARPAWAGVRGGFMRAPRLPAPVARAAAPQSSLPRNLQLHAVRGALAAALAHERDLARCGGLEAWAAQLLSCSGAGAGAGGLAAEGSSRRAAAACAARRALSSASCCSRDTTSRITWKPSFGCW